MSILGEYFSDGRYELIINFVLTLHIIQIGCPLRNGYNYLITHNVSSDQSPITTNRTNVTLYGMQPGETYTVEMKLIVLSPTQTFNIPTRLVYIAPVVSQLPVCTPDDSTKAAGKCTVDQVHY